jgi:hypothetical protein
MALKISSRKPLVSMLPIHTIFIQRFFLILFSHVNTDLSSGPLSSLDQNSVLVGFLTFPHVLPISSRIIKPPERIIW